MNKKTILSGLLLIAILNLQWIKGYSSPDEKPLIFPVPNDIQLSGGNFVIDKSTFIVLPEKPLKSDAFLADLLFAEFSDKFEQPVFIKRLSVVSGNEKYILMGDISNPLIKKYCKDNNLLSTLQGLGSEGYILSVTGNAAVVAANTKNGALFGMESLRQIISKDGETLSLPQLVVKDSPGFPFRGIKVYLPGRENITFFKRFIKDFVALYKFNTIILELNANMRLEKHPELNVGAVQFERHLNFSRLDRPPGVHKEYQNSSHQDNADGGILEKAEVADIVNYMRQFNIEVIPELPSLTHSYYLLWGHRELAENLAQPYPDTYCPLKPESYKLYFDVLDEYIEVIHPSMIHIGHDEWRMEKDLCELCRGKDYGELYAMDINKIHGYLAKKGIKIALWGDHFLESVTKKEFQTWKSSSGYQYKIPGAMRPEQVIKLIPKDIIIFNWFWDELSNDRQVSDFGFNQVYGNFRANINEWNKRQDINGLLGGAPSSWSSTTETNFGKDQLTDFLGASNLLWSKEYLSFDRLTFMIEPLIRSIYSGFSGKFLPSQEGAKVSSIDISDNFNTDLSDGIESLSGNKIIEGKVNAGNICFDLLKSSDNHRASITATQLI
ncbi:MAG: hexosaminidase, partial [Bacteroidota bacterium]|nr:hexosaminidase [Bacteroidota bacterium]